MYNQNDNNLFGYSGSHVTLKHLIETFGNENPQTKKLLPQLYNDRTTLSRQMPVLQKDKNYYNAVIKKTQRKAASSSKINVRKPHLLKPNPLISETLALYGTLLREIFDQPSLLSPIYYDPQYKFLEPIVKLLTEALLPSQFDQAQEHILTNIMEDIMEYEFESTEDLTTYLRENTAATKLLGAYLRREPVAQFVNEIVEEACAHCVKIEKEDLEIDPSAIWEKEMNKISTTVSYNGPDDPKIVKLCNKRREILKQYIDFILSKIMNAKKYPIGLRIVCKKLAQLAESKEKNNERLKNSLIGGFIFLRIFNPKIAYYGKIKSQEDKYKKYASEVRRKFTLISKILQNISNQVRGGMKEKWMASMNEYIQSKCELVSSFFRELTSIPPLTSYFNIDTQILANSPECESIYISIQELKLLTTMILDDKVKQKSKKYKIKGKNINRNHYYDLINQIVKKKMFSMIPMDDNSIAWHVMLTIPKPNQPSINSNKSKDGALALNLNMKVKPVLRELQKQDQLISYLFDLQPKDLVNDTIEFLQFSKINSSISDIQGAMNVLIKHPNPKITKELLIKLHDESLIDTQIYKRLKLEVSKMKEYEKKLTKEVNRLQVEYERIIREQQKAKQLAQQQHQQGKGKLGNIISIINGKLPQSHSSSSTGSNNKSNSPNNFSENKQQMDQTSVELTENIVATDGMIGNMLLTLVKDVGLAMTNNIQLNIKNFSSQSGLEIWSNFPQNVPSYFPIIQRVARLGKICMHELIYTIVEGDKEVGRTRDSKRFKFTTLRNHIPSSTKEKELYKQICNYIIDFMMVDMLQHCMKWMTPSELYTTELTGKYNKFHIEVNNKCIQKLQTIRGDKLGNELFQSWSLKRLRKWGVLISILSPTYPECVVDNFKLLYNAYPNDADGFLFGASYIKFHCDNNSVACMKEYFDWIYSLIVKNQESSHRLKLIMLTLEHNIRSLEVNNDILNPIFIMKIQSKCFTELYKVFASRGRIKGFKIDALDSPFRRLRSSMLLRSPGSINNHSDASNWLTALAGFTMKDRKNTQKASDLLHFLRGGGSSWDEAISRQYKTKRGNGGGGGDNDRDNNIPILDRKNTSYIPGYGGISDDGYPILEQAYGRIEPRLQLNSELCKILCSKLYKPGRTYDQKKQAVQIFMLSACAIQLCVHNFQYAIKYVIQLFANPYDKESTIERIFIAVYALNFICLPECKFQEFMKYKICQENILAWKEMSIKLVEEKRKLHRQLKALFEYLGNKAMPISKNLLSLADSRSNFTIETLQAQDEKIMFESHVSKMLLFDWTDMPMEKYMLPISNIEIELLIYCLRLAPHIECEELWESTEPNCSKTGTFIGKWLLHKDEKVREQVLRTLLVAMKDASKRSAIMKCFIEMLLHHDWQTPACLTMLLKTITHLLDHYRKLVVLDEESKKRHHMPRINMANNNNNNNLITNNNNNNKKDNEDPLRKGKELPSWFAWQNRADALGLVLLCHYHEQVRTHALKFLNKIRDIYKEFTGVGGGSVYIKNAAKITIMKIRTVGGLIATHGRSIARRATMKYDDDTTNKQNVDTNRRSSTYQPQTTNVNFQQCIHQWGLIPFCISQLAKRVCQSHLHETILNVLDVLLYTLSFMPPHTAASRDKTGWSSQQEWQGNNFIRGYWISLHTLFFSIIGCGLSSPFSISNKSDLKIFKQELKYLGNESYKTSKKQFEAYLDEFWYCLYEESLWVKDAINSILLQTNWESIPIVLFSINKIHHVSQRRRKSKKNIISDTVYLLKNLSQTCVQFHCGIYIGGESLINMIFQLINDVKLQAFTPDRMQKKRWWETQVELAEFYAYCLRALSKIGAHNELRNEFWDYSKVNNTQNNIESIRSTWLNKENHVAAGIIKKDLMPHIKKSITKDRFNMFKWLLQFLVDVDNIITPFVDPQDAREQRQRTIKVRRAVFQCLQYLLNMGCIIPTKQLQQDGYIIRLLRGTRGIDTDFEQHYSLQISSKNKCILQVFIEAEKEKFQVLTPLLTFQFESLISFYIEQASTHPIAKQLFFRAIVNVIQTNTKGSTMRLTAVESTYSSSKNNFNDWKIIRQRGKGFLESVFHYAHKLLFLGFIMIIEHNNPDTRYAGYLLLRSMADILVGNKLVIKIDKLKFAFESSMSLWVRKNGILISSYFANEYPTLGSLLFRVCIQYATEDKDRAEWTSSFLKPWATVIHLWPDQKINQKKKKNKHQQSKHETFTILSRLFDSTVDAKDDLQTSFLKVWTDLSQAFPYENLFAVLDFVLRQIEKAKQLPVQQFKNSIMPTVKNIFFAIYEPEMNRSIMIIYIIKIILNVLTIGANDYRDKGLIVKQRAAEILTTLEERLARDNNFETNDEKDSSNDIYKIHHEISYPQITQNQQHNSNSNSNNQSNKPSQHSNNKPHRYRYGTDPSNKMNGGRTRSNLPVPPPSNESKSNTHHTNELSPEEKRASIAAALLVELIGVDCEPIKPYFPVLVLYAALYIDKPSNHASMHNLLVRLIVTLSTNKTISEIEKNSNHSIDDNKPSLAAALTSRTLELLWGNNDDDNITVDINDGVSLKQFVHNQGDYVAIDGATFVKEYISQFESIHKPDLRTGYEALRWAVLSTNPEITTRSFHIYRQLLNPLNHCTVKVMLLALCGAIDNWEASEDSMHNDSISGSMSISKSQSEYKYASHNSAYNYRNMSHNNQQNNSQNNNNKAYTQEFRETQRILDTIIRMAEKLKELGQIYQYDSFVWTGIALLRADVKIEKQKHVFIKGLELLNIVLDDEDITLQYLFVNQYSAKMMQQKSRPSFEMFDQQNKNNNNQQQQIQQSKNVRFGGGGTSGGPMQPVLYESKQQFIDPYNNNNNNNKHTPQQPSISVTRQNPNQWRNYDAYKESTNTSGHNNNNNNNNNKQIADWQYEPEDYDYEPSESREEPYFTPMGPSTRSGPNTNNLQIQSNNEYNKNNNNNNNNQYNNQEDQKYDEKYDAPNPQMRNMNQQEFNYDIYSNDLAESFLSYCIDWSPPFEGIHPYLLQGLLEFDIEDNTFRVLKKVLTTKMDKLADRSSARPCLCIVSCLPYMYYIIRYKPEYFATISHSLFDSLILLTSSGNHMYNNPYQRLKNKFEFWSNCPINSDNVNILLKEFCQIIVQTFFNEHAGLVANYLNALLSSKKMIHHHTTVYKMAALFLNEDANYIQAFKDIIESAHHSLTEKMSSKSGTPLLHSNASNSNHSNNHNSKHQQQISLPNLNNIIDLNSLIDDEDYISEMADAATELVATGIRYLKDREKQRFTKNYNQGDFESTQGGPLLRENTPAGNSINIIRWDVNINNVTPFPQTGLKDVSNALWGVLTETRAIV